MDISSFSDTIAAIATSLGQGGIGIIRISGPSSKAIGEDIFCSARKSFSEFIPYTLHHGWIISQENNILDEVLVSFMPSPGSYTGEDVFEINCHGGPAVLQTILELVLSKGARLARPGEFTLRAFLNGRLDLSQAESIAEIVNASTYSGVKLATSKLQGSLKNKVSSLRDKLEHLRAYLCVDIDFPEDEVEIISFEDFIANIEEIKQDIKILIDNYNRFSCWREGVLVVLAGRVNAGKSSLLNALLGRERAIVTSVPGTTRDYIEETINLGGLPVRLVDTAGLREAKDAVEQAGLNHGKDIIEQASLVCIVYDCTRDLDEETLNLALRLGSNKVIVVANKIDLFSKDDISTKSFLNYGLEEVYISAKTGQGLEDLVRCLQRRLVGNQLEPEEGQLVPNLRQKKNLSLALQELEELETNLNFGTPYDVLDLHLKSCSDSLAEITGEIALDDILDLIFSQFCIGK